MDDPYIKYDETKTSDTITDDCDVPEPLWFRCNPTELDGINRFLIKSQLYYVLPGGIIFWIIFLFLQS